jgi:hypothetical protein
VAFDLRVERVGGGAQELDSRVVALMAGYWE